MIFFRKPNEDQIRRFMHERCRDPFSYTDVGATENTPPVGYTIDHNRIRLGSGRAIFEKAKDAVCRWEMFNFPWLQLYFSDTPIRKGELACVMLGVPGFWMLNICRITRVYAEDDGAVARFGFSYGTLDCHAESGEERFLIEWQRKDDSVWYDILAFSRPRHILAKCFKPIVRLLQKKFARDSQRSLLRAIQILQDHNSIM